MLCSAQRAGAYQSNYRLQNVSKGRVLRYLPVRMTEHVPFACHACYQAERDGCVCSLCQQHTMAPVHTEAVISCAAPNQPPHWLPSIHGYASLGFYSMRL